ncbi:Adenosylcobinamide-phosphate synthase [hydrothermal vent metagenome]|uniref:Adenosylcobinamide-phosphate synthase n=1 Tax=hydrothermal vent metagenome TaxID=652676 RepID=A0A1W1BGS8_9ZZZZ
MSNVIVAVLAYFIDRKFGEFSFIKHPIIVIGELISFFEKHLYKKSIFRGLLLVIAVITIVSFFVIALQKFLEIAFPPFLNILFSAFIASMFIAHKMLRDSVKDVLRATNKQTAISMLVSRDTSELSESDIYKAAIETYAENLSDGVIAPLFYLIFFGLPGIVIYKTINTMDSMIGYKNEKYEKFGKVAARLDDIANYIPSRLTALLIMGVAKQKNLFAFYKDGKKHDSPNAGHPITAMALAVGVQLGGDTSYFGKMKKKATFGEGKKEISSEDVQRALKLC